MRPIVLAHKWMFGFSLLASFIGLAVQVQIPNEVGQAIDALGQVHRSVARILRHDHRGARRDPVRAHVPLAQLPAQDGVPHRVRPAEHHVRAPQPHVVLVLRPGAVGPADLAGELRHPLGADVPHVRAVDPRAVQRRRPRVRGDAVDQRAAGARHDVDDAVRLHRRRAHAEADVPGVVAHPVAPRRRRHRRRREHQRRARGQVVRGRGPAAAAPHRAPRCGPSGPTSRTPTSGPSGRRCSRTCPASGRPSCCSTAGTSPSTARRRSATSSRSTPTC